MPAMEDPEEAAAWAALRAAFADDEPIAPVTGVNQRVFADADLSAHSNGDDFDAMCAMEEEEEVQTVATKGKGKVPSSKKHVAKPVVADVPEVKSVLDQNAWTRQQVDRLVGEVQRLADAAFPADLLRKLWRLSLDDQHDVLLGAVGTEGGLLETKGEKTERIWCLIQDEVDARGVVFKGLAGAGPRPPSSAPNVATLKVTRGRSRSRSPSI
eukprot:CAMPEP_0194504806 /NCGR_PEP_ID=MMETSP0253-20130528/29828_1 /TAXON_ID=2966 /ORGANISM="Noctiluca scintillans" /LENGTH=211 /DNA_ID=CAMNT_0039347257 /DNA_START=40 /DNA_END=675 /DNA_ORIENTATION=+